MLDLIQTLRSAVAARDEAARQHGENVRALDLGRQRKAAAQAELDRLAQQDQEAISRHARRLESQLREGNEGPVPLLMPSDTHLAAEITARRTFAAAELLVSNLEAAVRQSADLLTAAESTLHIARGDLVAIRVREMADELVALRARETELVRLIAVIRPGDPGAAQMPPQAIAALNSPPRRPTVDNVVGSQFVLEDINTPAGGQPALVAQARAYWTDYLADLERELAQEAAAA